MLLGAGCASLGRDARLYALEERLRTGGSDVPSLYEIDGKRYTIEETNGYFVIKDEEGRGALFTYPTEVQSRLIKNAHDLGQSLEGLARDFVDRSEFLYLDEHEKLQRGRNTGLLENLLKFLQHLASAITFGLYVPEGAEHLLHVPKALFQAVGDLAFGVPLSVGNMARHAIAAGVQMVQFVPILTLGHSEEAGEVSAQVFDYLQITLRTAANAVPLIGEGWQRTAAAGFHQGEWFPPWPITR